MTRARRVAIVGLGPKGLYALERLLDHAQGGAAMEIDIYEPHPAPGAGPNYDPAQPDYLRMNFTAAHVDMWWPGGGVVPAEERLSFVEWAECPPGSYPPRAQVGRYLAGGLSLLRRRCPANVAVTLHPSSVSAVVAAASGWAIAGSRYDAVLIATGHAPGSIYPVDTWLSRERVPPGSRVAVRGFALTFIDAALALTEGRGGHFERIDASYRLRYVPSPDDVVLLPYSRTGLPMLPKPVVVFDGLEPIMHAGRERIRELEDGLASILAQTTAAALLVADGSSAQPRRVPAAAIAHSLAVGAGRARPDMQWAIGETWRALYPAIVERLGGDALTAEVWPEFRRMAAEMERIAFGPSPLNAAKLLALIVAGRVDLGHVHGGPIPRFDVEIDAVMPGPEVRAPVIERLIRDGHVRVADGHRGVATAADATCAPGLAVLGRPTEDWVIGNDTLSRRLHPHADRWARTVTTATPTPLIV